MKETKSNYCEHCGEFHDPVRDYVVQVRVGEPVPDFEFEAHHEGGIKLMSLSAFRGKWLILAFYPADFAPSCARELAGLAKLHGKFIEAGAEIVAISSDSVFAHQAWRESSKEMRAVGFPLAADPSGKIAYAFGVLVEGGEAELTPEEGLALRGTFIIDPAGILRAMEVHDGAVERNGAELLRKLKAAQGADTRKV